MTNPLTDSQAEAMARAADPSFWHIADEMEDSEYPPKVEAALSAKAERIAQVRRAYAASPARGALREKNHDLGLQYLEACMQCTAIAKERDALVAKLADYKIRYGAVLDLHNDLEVENIALADQLRDAKETLTFIASSIPGHESRAYPGVLLARETLSRIGGK